MKKLFFIIPFSTLNVLANIGGRGDGPRNCGFLPCPEPPTPTPLENLQSFINGIIGPNGLLHLENPVNSIIISILSSTIVVLFFWSIYRHILKQHKHKK